jgi:hypothetical protein
MTVNRDLVGGTGGGGSHNVSSHLEFGVGVCMCRGGVEERNEGRVNVMDRIKGRGEVPLKVVMSRGKVSTRGKANPKNGEWPRWRWSTGGALRLVKPEWRGK